ncbi:hypothetical protein Tco_1258403, partial [Tanacetum coccineum]
LTSLPLSYDNSMETLLYGRDTLKLEDVLATLYSSEFQKMTEANGDGGEGLYVKGRFGGFYHITYRRDYLVDFEEYNGGNILLGDGKECRSGLSKVFWTEDTTMSTYLVNRSPSSAIRFKTPAVLYRNMGFNESAEYKKTFIGSGVGTGLVQVLQGVEFEVEPQEDHTFEVALHGNFDCVAGSQEVQTQDLIYYHSTLGKIYAHESLTFNNTVACEVISKWKAGLKDDIDARSYVYVLSNGYKKCSDDSDGYYWELETDIQKRTKNKGKNDKTEHGIEKYEKTKPNQSQKVNQVKKSTEQSNSQSQSQPRQSQSQLRETKAEKTTWGTTIAKSQSCILRIRTTRTEVAIS